MTKYKTARFGEVEVNSDSIIRIPEGPVGFPDYEQFVFIDQVSETPFRTLQSLDNPEFSLVVVDPLLARQDFQFDVTMDVLKQIEAISVDNIEIYVTAKKHQHVEQITVNLKAPFLINSRVQIGCQYVIPNASYQKNEKFKISAD